MKYKIFLIILLYIFSLMINSDVCSQKNIELNGNQTGKLEFHYKVGKGLEALYADQIEEYYEILAYHYGRSNDKEKAIYYLVKSGDKSKAMYTNNQAIDYYNQALKIIDGMQGATNSMRGCIYLSLAEINWRFEDYEKVLSWANKSLEFNSDKKQRAESYRLIGLSYVRQGKLDLSIKNQNLAIAELGDDKESSEMASISYSLFWPTIYSGRIKEAIEIAQCGIEIGIKTENYFALAQLYICLVWANMEPSYGINDIDKGFEYANKSIEAAKSSGDPYSIGNSTFWLGWAYKCKGEDEVAIELMKKAINIQKKTGDHFCIHQAFGWLSGIYMKRKDVIGFVNFLQDFVQ